MFFSFLVINLIISCRTKRASSSLSAVSDRDFKLSLVKSSFSLDSDNSDLSVSDFYDFYLCSKKSEDECVNVFATDDGAKISFNIAQLNDLESSLSLSIEEIDEIKSKVEKTGLVNQLKLAQKKDALGYDFTFDIGYRLFIIMLIIKELQLYNKDQAQARKVIASTIANLNSKVMESTTRVVFIKNLNQSNIGIYNALNQNYLHSKKISGLFLTRKAQFASLTKKLSGKKPISIRAPSVIAFYAKKAQEIDKEFIDNLEAYVKKAQSSLSSTKLDNINKGLIDASTINDYLTKRSDDLSKFLKETKKIMAADGSKSYKRTQFNALADFYAKIGKRNKKLFDSDVLIASKVEKTTAKEAANSLIKSARSAKSTLRAQTTVLETLYAKPLFAGSKIDFLGRRLAQYTVKAAEYLQVGTKSVKKLVTHPLTKPILIVVGIAGATGAIYSAFRHKPFSKQDYSKTEDGENDVKADAISKVEMASPEQSQELAAKSQFYHSVHAAFSMDESIDQSVDSVIDFVKKLALYLNTNLLEGDLKITKLCFPITKEDEHFLVTKITSSIAFFNKKEYCKSI